MVPQVAGPPAFARRVGRDTFINQYLAHVNKNWSNLKTDKTKNVLPAIHSPPGGGKSYIVDKLAEPDEGMMQLKYADRVFKNTRPLPITFNYHSTWEPLRGYLVRDELIIRFLHS